MRTYSAEQRKKAVETFASFGRSAADTMAELGHPSRVTLRSWRKEYQVGGDESLERRRRRSRCSDEERRGAVDHCLEHGKGLARTIRAMGYPSREMLGSWADELAPGRRKCRGPDPKKGAPPIEVKARAVAELEARGGGAAEVAGRHGVSRGAPYVWRRGISGHDGGAPEEKGAPVGRRHDEPPDDVEELEKMRSDLKARVRKLQLEIDARQATLEILKKDPGTGPKRPTNAEKAAAISSLRPKWRLKGLPASMRMAKSSYEYAAGALARPEGAGRADARAAVVRALGGGGAYGYRRIAAQTGIGEWAVRATMGGEPLVARAAKRRRRYGSHQGKISEAPGNLLRDGRGKHRFRAGAQRAPDNGRHGVPHPRRKDPPLPDNRLLRRHADRLGHLHVPGRGDGELVASGRMLPAQGGRAPQGAQRPRLPLSLARVDKDMRGSRHREVDVEEGLQPGQRARRGFLRKAEDRVLPRRGLERGRA